MGLIPSVILGVILWICAEPLGAMIQRAFAPGWHAFVRRLNGRRVILLWGLTVGAMTVAWGMAPDAGNAALLGRTALFLVPPAIAMAATGAWRDRRSPPGHRRGSAY